MSEYQYVALRAIDAPVGEKNLAYMRRQSTRAKITPWSFDNEYHFGDFGGDSAEMLRRGYDFHLHYANYGIRTLMIRLPAGLPDAKAAAPYFDNNSLQFVKDKQGPGGILEINPYFEPGDLEDLWDVNQFFGRLLPLRSEIIEGDLRPLYMANLVIGSDGDPDELQEPPVPAGLDEVTDAQCALAELYGVDETLIAAAACGGPPMPARTDARDRHNAWLARQPQTAKNAWLAKLMAEPNSTVRSELLSEFQKTQQATLWPTAVLARSFADLRKTADELQQQRDRRKATATAASRARHLKKLASDPAPSLRKIESLVREQTTDAYEQIAKLLADLREALADTKDAALPDQQAHELTKRFPTRRVLSSTLRRHGFLKK